jgi:hypothetical protein
MSSKCNADQRHVDCVYENICDIFIRLVFIVEIDMEMNEQTVIALTSMMNLFDKIQSIQSLLSINCCMKTYEI